MNKHPYARELSTAILAVQQAAKLSQSVISAADKGVVEKDDLSPVTVADFAIQALLTASIHHAFPDDAFVGEESAAELRADPDLLARVWGLLQGLRPAQDEGRCWLPASADEMCEMIDWCGHGVPPKAAAGEQDDKRTWVFDPIDGTQTFVQGKAYAINVALLQGGRQILSCVGCPTFPVDWEAAAPLTDDTKDPTGRGLIIFAARGHGTYIRPLAETAEALEGTKIEAHADTAQVEDLKSVTCFKSLVSGVDDAHQAIVERLGAKFPGCDLLGWVPRWVTLALGAANMTVWVYKKRDRVAKIWDHAGAMLLYEEVGGKVTDIDGKDIDLTAGRHLSENHGFVAAPRSLHTLVLKTLKQVLEDQGKQHLLA